MAAIPPLWSAKALGFHGDTGMDGLVKKTRFTVGFSSGLFN